MRTIQGRPLIKIGIDVEAPLIGSIAFGLIDRGTNIVQVRPVSYCNLCCIMCSTDAGPCSRWRQAEYWVDLDLIVEWFKGIVKFKGGKHIEAHIDTVGEPTLYSRLIDLIQELKSISGVEVVSMQTHGQNLSVDKVEDLEDAGLDRVNLSVDALDPELARYIQGAKWYNVEKVISVAEYLVQNTRIDLHVAPILLKGINDEEIPRIIKWALEIGAGKRWPPLGIQKYVPHRHGRKPKNVKVMSWSEFWAYLKNLERRFNVKLIPSMEDFGIKRMNILPIPFKVGEKVRVKVVAPGWLKSEKLAVDMKYLRTITIIRADHIPLGSKVNVRIIRNKHNIYIAEPLV